MTTRLSSVRRLSKVLLLSMLLTLLPAALSEVPSAAAATLVSGVEYVVARSPENSLSKSVVAHCPPGKRVIGGGGQIIGHSNPALTLLRPARLVDGTRDAYLVTAVETYPGTSAVWTVLAIASCAYPHPDMFMISRTTSPSSSSVQTSAIGCNWVIGTGAGINTTSGRVVLQVARPSHPGDLARAQAHEVPTGYDGNWTLTSYAICMKSKPVGYTVVFERSWGDLSGERKQAWAYCPPGTRVLSGGAATADSAPGHVSLHGIYPSYYSSEAEAVENTATNLPWDFIVATAICAS
jgi:hypothetical protein